MSFYKVGNYGILLEPGLAPRQVDLSPVDPPPALTPVPFSAALAVTGHSVPDAIFVWPWAGVITDAGSTPTVIAGTGPYATAQFRWTDDPAAPNAVKAALTAGGPTSFDLFLGIEAHGGSYDGRASVAEHIEWSDAYGYAVLWHNLAASKGADTFYANFWRDDTAEVFGAAWRAAQNIEAPLWDGIIDYVNANRAGGTPAMRLVPWLQVFMAIYDAIGTGTVTGITMADLFSDGVHPSDIGAWVQMAAVMAVMYQRHPDQLSHSISFEFGGSMTISSSLAAQLRPVIWAACLATTRSGLSGAAP